MFCEHAPFFGIDYPGAFPSWGWPGKGTGWVPDLLDVPTGGVLLGQLQSRWTKQILISSDLPGSWEVLCCDLVTGEGPPAAYGSTLAEACARMLVQLA